MKTTSQIRMKFFIFKYEVAWDFKAECAEIVKEAWYRTSNYQSIQNIIHKCKMTLLKWKNTWREKEGERQRTQNNLLGHIQEAGTSQHIAKDQKVQDEIQKILEEENII